MIKTLVLLLFLTSCGHLFYQPNRFVYATPKTFGHKYEDLYFHSLDGTKLHSWLIKPELKKGEKIKGTILFFHGNAQNLTAHFYNLAWISKHGYQLLIFDYRGYGSSEGKADKEGILLDAKAALDFSYQLHQKTQAKDFIIYGQSLGGIIVIPALAEFAYKNQVSKIVFDSTFHSYQWEAFEVLKNSWLLLPISPLAFLLVSDHLEAKDYMNKLPQVPYLHVHGDHDRVVSYKLGQKLYELNPHPNKKFLQVVRGEHIDVYHREDGKYRSQLLEFLK